LIDGFFSFHNLSAGDLSQLEKVSPAIQRYRTLNEQSHWDLKTQRHFFWNQAAASSILDHHHPKDICHFWSDRTDELLQRALEDLSRELQFSDFAVFAVGKLGSHELNLSSDIDLIILCSEEHLSLGKQLVKLLSHQLSASDERGFCYRIDYDLRPGGKLGPLLSTPDQFMDWYGNYGEAWERLALVRLRPLFGKSEIVHSILEFRDKFCFRKHLDFQILSDLKLMREKVLTGYAHRSQENQIDLKLGAGGIRDLELFVHTLQIIHGGKVPSVRLNNTDSALTALEKLGFLSAEDSNFLISHYWQLRDWENKVQAIDDLQTHLLPSDFTLLKEGQFLALRESMEGCSQIVSGLLGKVSFAKSAWPEEEELQMKLISSWGFSEPEIRQTWKQIQTTPILSRQKERDESARKQFLFEALKKMGPQCVDHALSMKLLSHFIEATKAKTSFFTMCLASEKLLDDIARWFATSTYLSQRVIQSPELLDALVLNQSDLTVLELDQELTHLSDYKFLREAWIISRFLESLDLRTFSHALTQTADEIALAVLTQLKKEFPSTQLQIIAGGKWGGREFGINSDLDLLFFSSGETSSEIKVARRWMNRITELRKGGALYKIDLRLTPQYSSGVLLQAEQTFMDYVATKSSAWERQAFLRLRAIESSISLQAAIKARTLTTSELQELKKIQSQLFLTAKSELDVKLNPGGLLHTELVAQTIALLNQRDSETTSSTLDLIEKYLPAEVLKTYLILKSIEQLHRIFSESSAPLSEQSTSLRPIIAKLQTWSLGTSSIEFSSNIKAMLSDNAARLQSLDPRETAE
jgi:glutamate-ammonia-ligase adenylyltransferase